MLKVLMLQKERDGIDAEIEQLRAVDFAERERELEADIDAAQTDEERSAVADAVDAFDAEKREHDSKLAELKSRSDAITEQIEQLEQRQAEAVAATEKGNDMNIEKSAIDILCERAAEVDTAVKGWKVSGQLRAATDAVKGVQVVDTDTSVVVSSPARAAVAGLFGSATISGNAITYFVQGDTTGKATKVAENAKKPQLSLGFTPVTKPLSKIAGYVKETDEILNDAPFLASAVQNELLYQLGVTEDSAIMGEVLGTTGIQSVTYAEGKMVDAILKAKAAVAQNSPFTADFVAINPEDMVDLLTATDKNGQYLGGGFFQGAYGNGDYTQPARIWGLPIFETSEVAAGTVLVGAGKQAVQVYRKGGVDVNIYEQNEDDALYNRVTLLAEERLAVAVKYPKGLVKVTKTA